VDGDPREVQLRRNRIGLLGVGVVVRVLIPSLDTPRVADGRAHSMNLPRCALAEF
jgi:hypothetical protein